MVIAFPKIKFSKGVCQGCILGKHPEHKYERFSHEKTFAPLDLIHSDIVVPLPHMSRSQSKYVLTFIDEFFKYFRVFFLKYKLEVFDLFKGFKALLENQYRRKLKVPRYDNGGEYFKYEFIQFYEYACIHIHNSIPYTPIYLLNI